MTVFMNIQLVIKKLEAENTLPEYHKPQFDSKPFFFFKKKKTLLLMVTNHNKAVFIFLTNQSKVFYIEIMQSSKDPCKRVL